MTDDDERQSAAVEICAIARSEYQKYLLRTQAASYAGTPAGEFADSVSKNYGPDGDWTERLAKGVSFNAHLYLAMAERHLSALEVLIENNVLGVPIGPPCRSIEEAAGRTLWLLDNSIGIYREDARTRVSRLLLDDEHNTRIHKDIAYKFDHPERHLAGDVWARAKKVVRKPGVFYASEISEGRGGRAILREQTLPGPVEFVKLAGRILGDPSAETTGYYSYISSMTHPTVFTFVETLENVTNLPSGWTRVPYRHDSAFALKLASNAVRAFHNAWRAWISWTDTGMNEADIVYEAHTTLPRV